VAGAFYPAGADELTEAVDAALGAADPVVGVDDDAGTGAEGGAVGRRPKALIVPHAGYVYSGSVAAGAFARLWPWRAHIAKVVLLGPAHRVPVRSMAVSSAAGWDTPLGRVAVDAGGRERVLALDGVEEDDGPHGPEHSLEVELPFLQRILTGGFTLLPIVVGHAPAGAVAAVLDAVWGGDETLIVISSDLSHYEDYAGAAEHDRRTADHILAGRLDEIGPHDACGAFPVRGLLAAARARLMDIELVDLRSSGDTAGPRDRVVGYASFVLSASTPAGRRAWTGAAAGEEPPGAGPPGAPCPPAGDEDTDTDTATATATASVAVTVPLDPAVAVAGTGPDAGPGPAVTERSGDAPARAAWVLATSDDDTGGPIEPPALSPADEELVLDVALEAIRARLEDRDADGRAGEAPGHLRQPAASFVTLRDGARLLGCIGSIEARRPLLDDVADNAVGAAFRDPRMPALTPFEFGRMSVHVSLLSRPELLAVRSRPELHETLVPGVDGLLIEAGRRRGTFLPAVWHQVPEPGDFLDQLWRKAGLAPRSWPGRLRVWRYRTVEFGEEGPRRPIRSLADPTKVD
jgi:AmmeMemoRadiSam system protein B/AmmeMemoRadiSam system protein A